MNAPEIGGGYQSHSIMFRPPRRGWMEDFVKVLPRCRIDSRRAERVDGRSKSVRAIVTSDESFEVSPPAEGPPYKYDLFLAEIDTSIARYAMGIFPYWRLGRVLFERIAAQEIGRALQFIALDLMGLLRAVHANRHARGALTVVRFNVDVRFDPRLSGLVLRGADAVHSRVYASLTKLAGEHGMKPRNCELVHDNHHDPRIRFQVDRFGNSQFYLRKDAGNIAGWAPILSFLESEALLRQSTELPFRRILLDDA